jgi:hypothetical protein
MKTLYYLNRKFFDIFKNYKDHVDEYHKEQENIKLQKQQSQEELENSLKELEQLKAEHLKAIEEKEKEREKLKQELDSVNSTLLEETKLKLELQELKKINKKEETELINKEDIEILKEVNEGKIKSCVKQNELKIEALNKSNAITLIELKYDCLKDNIYNVNEFDELIEITQKKTQDILNDELDNLKEQRQELEDYEKSSKKKLENLKEKSDLEIQKKQFELKNFKLIEYNKLMDYKKKMFEDFKQKFSANQLSNENLKNKEIEKAKMYFEQQKNNILFREQIFNQQKQNIHALMKQLEINDDEYSKNLLKILQ